MNFIKRAQKSVFRKKGKAILLFAIIFVLGNIVAGSLAIKQATDNVETKIKNELGANVSIVPDDNYWQNGAHKGETLKPLTKELFKKVGALSYVKSYDYNLMTVLTTKKLKAYSEQDDNADDVITDGSGNDTADIQNANNYFYVKGTSYPGVYDVKQNKIKIVEGRQFKKEELDQKKNVAVISKKLADQNGIAVGDTMAMDAVFEGGTEATMGKSFTKDVPFEIIGLYEVQQPKNSKSKSKEQAENTEIYNYVYTTNSALEVIAKDINKLYKEKMPEEAAEAEKDGVDIDQEYYDGNIFTLKSPEDIKAFTQEATPLVQQFKGYKLIVSSDRYDQVAGPIKNMGGISNFIIWLSIFTTVLVVALVILLFLRDRRRELGIYLAIGEKRKNILAQIILEVIVIAFLALSCSMISGNIIAGSVSDKMITNTKLSQANSNQEDLMGDDYYMNQISNNVDLSESSIKEAYQVKLTPAFIISFYILGLLTILLATAIPLIYILRLNPKEILL